MPIVPTDHCGRARETSSTRDDMVQVLGLDGLSCTKGCSHRVAFCEASPMVGIVVSAKWNEFIYSCGSGDAETQFNGPETRAMMKVSNHLTPFQDILPQPGRCRHAIFAT
jgi:hypothetical protein